MSTPIGNPPFFCRVTGLGISPEQPFYILGVMHHQTELDYPPQVVETIKNCDVLVVEQLLLNDLDTLRRLDGEVTSLLQLKFRNRDIEWLGSQMQKLGYSGENLQTNLSFIESKLTEFQSDSESWSLSLTAEKKDKIQTILKKYGLSLEGLHPFFVAATIAQEKRFCFQERVTTIEISFLKHFAKTGRLSQELEDFTNVSLIIMINTFVNYTLNSVCPVDYEEKMNARLELMESQTQLDTLPYEYLQDYYHRLGKGEIISEDSPATIYRNTQWYTKLGDLIFQNAANPRSTAIVVGAGHVVAPTGILNFLRQMAGLTIEKL